ncbi:MAG: M67 family metallopeptidase [Gammaproteobacteria bacterium]|jgi:[CysO sulfur-carrier protein]-S-L-cysteine hydrolase|nr:M67 family metallopeptidase [Gammaproteobacteria bacterium]
MSEHLPRTLALQLLTEAQKSPQREVCGMISGQGTLPKRLIPIQNIATTPETLFEMEPQQQIHALREIREQGEQLWAIYHSHPQAPATPSPRDLAEAAYPDALYLVISLNTEGVLEIRGFRLGETQFDEVALEVTDY